MIEFKEKLIHLPSLSWTSWKNIFTILKKGSAIKLSITMMQLLISIYSPFPAVNYHSKGTKFSSHINDTNKSIRTNEISR